MSALASKLQPVVAQFSEPLNLHRSWLLGMVVFESSTAQLSMHSAQLAEHGVRQNGEPAPRVVVRSLARDLETSRPAPAWL